MAANTSTPDNDEDTPGGQICFTDETRVKDVNLDHYEVSGSTVIFRFETD